MSAANLRDKILAAKDIRSERVRIEEWDAEVEVRGMTGAQRAKLMQGATNAAGEMDVEKLYPALLIETVHHPETGEPVFTAADRDALNAKSSAALDRVAKVAMRVAGLDSESRAEAGNG